MNVFNLDLNVAMESDFFNEAGSLFRVQDAWTKKLAPRLTRCIAVHFEK